MSGDERAPAVFHRGFLGFNHLAHKLRKASNKATITQNIYEGFEVMIQGKTARSWMANLLTLVGKDLTSSSSPSSSYITYSGSKSSLSTPSFDSKLIIDCAAAASTGEVSAMSPAVMERVLADQTPLTFNEALKADAASVYRHPVRHAAALRYSVQRRRYPSSERRRPCAAAWYRRRRRLHSE